jgi:SAM-dependent methyltransferase
MSVCSICGGGHARHCTARDLRFAIGGNFTYGECGGCGALELLNPPHDLAVHYPASYYAFNPARRPRWKDRVRRARNRVVLGRSGPLSSVVRRLKPHAATPWLARTRATRYSRILDVGSGNGDLLRDLALAGFRSLLGVDLYINETVNDPMGFRVIKGSLADVSGQFDLVMFHHSLEHMADPVSALAAASRLTAPGGWCLVRLPIVPSYAWEHYGVHWIQLDAPRHLWLHSIASLAHAAKPAELTLEAVQYDSTAYQFVGSEMYRRGLPLDDMWNAFSRREIRAFERRARDLNEAGQGDQASFYFRRASAPVLQR